MPVPTVVDESILQVKQTEAQFVCEVAVPTEAVQDQIDIAAAAVAAADHDGAAAAAQPVSERGPIHFDFDSHFDRWRWKMLAVR